MICIDLYFAFFCAPIVQYFLVYWEFLGWAELAWESENKAHHSRLNKLSPKGNTVSKKKNQNVCK